MIPGTQIAGIRDAVQLLRTSFLVAILVLTLVLLTVLTFGGWQVAALDSMSASREDVRLLRRARTTMTERDGAIRLAVIAGDSVPADVGANGGAPVRAVLDSLYVRLDGDSAVTGQVRALDSLVGRWERDFLTPAIARRPTDPGGRFALLRTGEALFDSLRGQFIASSDTFERRYQQLRRTSMNLRIAELTLIGIELFIVVGFLLHYRRQLLARGASITEQQEKLEEQAIELEQQALELESANQELVESLGSAELARKALAGSLSELRVQTALLSSALDSSTVGIAFFDDDLRFVRVNDAMERMTGAPLSESIGRPVAEVPTPDGERLTKQLRQVLDSGEPSRDIAVVQDSGRYPARITEFERICFPIRTPDGEVLGVGLLMEDISERRSLEEQLRHAQKMEAVGQLAGGIAHDFNNLLTVISGHTELLLDGGVRPEAVGDAEQIQRAVVQASALTGKLLAFSRKQVIVPRPINLSTVVRDVVPMLRRLIRENIEIRLNTAERLTRISADPNQVEQILLNLAVNARDAMGSGGVLSIQTTDVQLDDEYLRASGLSASPGTYVSLVVSDTGSGMTSEVKRHAFEPFFTTKEPGKGTGMGLAMVYGIVRQAGGHILLYSEPGRGTTFRMLFPPGADEEGRSATPEKGGEAVRGGSERVLLIEDDAAVLALALRVLSGLGYTVHAAESGAQAVALLQNGDAVDVVVSDVVMPGLSGRELIQQIRARNPDVRLIFMSGYTGEDPGVEQLIADADAFLQKPFTRAALASAVRSVLDMRRS